MSRLGNFCRAGLLVTVPLMLQACGDTNLTLEEALSHTKLSVDELSECFETDPKFEGDSCKGSMVQLRGAVRDGELLLTDLCHSPHNRSLEIFAPGSRDGENQVLAELHATLGCVEAIYKLKDGGLVPLFITEVESPEVLWARIAARQRLRQERQEAERLAAEEAERLAQLKALRERCVETVDHGDVCLLSPNNYKPYVFKETIRQSGLIYPEKKGQLLTVYEEKRKELDPSNAQYVDVDGNSLDFLDVAYDYELATAHKRIDEATIENVFVCNFTPASRSTNDGKSWRSYIVNSDTALISERHWYVGYEGDIWTSTDGSAIRDGEALIIERLTTRWELEDASFYADEEQYEVVIDIASLEDDKARRDRESRIKIDRKTAEANYYGDGKRGQGICSVYDEDIKVLLKKIMTDKVDTFMKGALQAEKGKRERAEAERRRNEERAGMEKKL